MSLSAVATHMAETTTSWPYTILYDRIIYASVHPGGWRVLVDDGAVALWGDTICGWAGAGGRATYLRGWRPTNE